MSEIEDSLRHIPSVDRLLGEVGGADWARSASRPLLLRAVREAVRALREGLKTFPARDAEDLESRVAGLPRTIRERLRAGEAAGLQPVVNATGVVIHTNLGRSVLADVAIEAMTRVAGWYSNLEFDLEDGARGSRGGAVEALLQAMTGAEKALVVNNNAAALLLALRSLARGREVVVSRGELVEIGGGFRLPEVMEESGAILREVGTTNRTRLEDYRCAVNDRTAALLKVHTSNYRIVGFTEAVDASELAALGRSVGVPFVEDLGSGMLLDLKGRGIGDEPSVRDVVKSGTDLVCFSGDKLLGGPQAGILVGRRDLVEQLGRSPLARAVRADKFTLASLEATLRLSLDPERSLEQNPTLRMTTLSEETLRKRALRLARAIRVAQGGSVVSVERGESAVGGGSFPGLQLATWLVCLTPGRGTGADELLAALRRHDPPVVARISNDRVVLDPRTLLPGQERMVAAAAVAALSKLSASETENRPWDGTA